MSVNFLQNTTDTIACFSDGYGTDNKGKFYKKALILAEGHWTDNKNRPHVFDKARLFEIVKNTNNIFNTGYKIPLLKDHNKTTDSVIGELDSPVEIREITEEDITSDRFRHLIGKLGVFASKVLISSSDAINKIQENLINTISPGIDIVENCIKEISATPIPAIPGMSLFSRSNAYFSSSNGEDSLYWDEDDNPETQVDNLNYVYTEFKLEFDKLSNKYLKIVYNIIKAPTEKIANMGTTRLELMEDALDNYVHELEELTYGGEKEVEDLINEFCTFKI